MLLNFGGTAISAGWPAVPPGIFAIIFVIICGNIYINAQLPLKRHMSNNRSPILSNLGTVLSGMGEFTVLISVLFILTTEIPQFPCERTVHRTHFERNLTSGLIGIRRWLGPIGISTGGFLDDILSLSDTQRDRWIAIRMDSLGGLFAGIVAAWLVYGGTFSAGTVGFTLTLISAFSGMLVSWIRLINEAEVQANRYDT